MANPAPDTREDAAPYEPPLISTTWCPWMDTSVPDTREDAATAELPEIPKEFGEDNGEFYKHYDALAEKLDDNMIKSLKEQLDGLLLFAGLFAGVNATFLALTLPLLTASPADDTNALLRENNAILLQLALNRSDSLPIAGPLPSESFSVSGRVLTVNILFSISLTFALMSSLFAVLGRGWLVEYLSHSGSGVDNQRRERISRYLGARRWGLRRLLGEVLPSLLQVGLILFGTSLTIYLGTLHYILAKIAGAFLGTGMAFLVCIAIFAIWDPYCPFQTPLSRLITYIIPASLEWTVVMVTIVGLGAVIVVVFPIILIGSFASLSGLVIYPWAKERDQEMLRTAWQYGINQLQRLYRFAKLVKSHFPPKIAPPAQDGKRVGVALTISQAEAVGRVICYSDDPAALMNAILNLLSIGDSEVLRRLASNDQFCHSLSLLCRTSHTDAPYRQDTDRTRLETAVTWRYRAAMAHVAFSGSRSVILLEPASIRRSFSIDGEPGLAIPPALIKASSPFLINRYLGYLDLLSVEEHTVRPILGQTIAAEFEGLIDSSWKRISIIIACMNLACRKNGWNYYDVREASKGNPSTVIQNLWQVLRKCIDPGCGAHNTSYKYLVQIFKFIRKAAIDSSSQSTIGIDLIARLLHLSEVFLRVKECPVEFPSVARGLRRDLISAFRSECEKMVTRYRIATLRTAFTPLEILSDIGIDIQPMIPTNLIDTAFTIVCYLGSVDKVLPTSWYMLDTLSVLFTDLTAVGNRLTISSNEDDLELAHLFRPVLERLDELSLGRRSGIQVRRLRRKLENFVFIIDRVALVKSAYQCRDRTRDPELRWCHWREEMTF